MNATRECQCFGREGSFGYCKDKTGFETVTVKRASEEIYDQIRQKITDGELRPGDRLPSEKNVMEMMHRSRATIRRRCVCSKGTATLKPFRAARVPWCKSSTRGAWSNRLTRSCGSSGSASGNSRELRDVIEVQTAAGLRKRRIPEGPRGAPRIPALEKKYAGNTRASL